MGGTLEVGHIEHGGRDGGHLAGEPGDGVRVHLVDVPHVRHKVGEVLHVVVHVHNGIDLGVNERKVPCGKLN